MNKIIMLLTVMVIFCFVSVSANATLITFSDKSQFLTSTGSTSATGPLPNLSFIPSGGQTVGSVTFSVPYESGLNIGGGGLDWTLLHTGNEIAMDGAENLNVDLASPVFALGFDFIEPAFPPCIINCSDSTFSVTLKNGTTTVDSFMFNAPDDVLAFVGVWADTSFNRVEIRDINATNDDEFFGEFYTGTTPASVPEPSALLLLGSGMAGIVVFRKSLRQRGIVRIFSYLSPGRG